MSENNYLHYIIENRNVFVYRTSKIEIRNLSSQDIENILCGEGNKFSHEDLLVVHNINQSIDALVSCSHDFLDFEQIKSYNRIVGQGLLNRPGEMRLHDVRIGGTSWTSEKPTITTITQDLEEAFKETDAHRRAMMRFAKVCRGQWFEDGNKRTAALVANHSLIHDEAGLFMIEPEAIESGEFVENLIDYYETNNIDIFVDWLIDKALVEI